MSFRKLCGGLPDCPLSPGEPDQPVRRPMHRFASGWKKSYYGKGDVSVYRLHRDPGQGAVFGANVLILIYGEAFWPTYTKGDNSSLVATDSMKNFIQHE